MKDIFGNNNYRFGVESFLLMYMNQYQLVLAADLAVYTHNQDFFDDENPCNLYFVLRKPKVTVDPSSIQIKGKKAKFTLLVHVREKTGMVNLSCEFLKANSEIEYFTEYPFNMLAFRDKEKALLVARPSTLLDSNIVIDNVDTEDLDYEILYIGQAYGKDGKRTALDRLASHETVQKISVQSASEHPDSDIWFMLANFAQQSIVIAAGADLIKATEEDGKSDKQKLEHLFKNNGLLISERQRITFTEAALIRYFEPKYNIEFKESFPSAKHKSYSECYSLAVKALTIELNTTDMVRKLYTEKAKRTDHHMKMFEFNSDADRISLLDVINE